jgi:hypothetical protein
MREPGAGIRDRVWVFSVAKGAAMFIFRRPLAAPLIALTVSALIVVLDVLSTVGTP